MEQQNNFSMTLGSLFDGSGGFLLGGVLAGIKPVLCIMHNYVQGNGGSILPLQNAHNR